MINQLHRVEFVCRFLCWSHKLVLHSTTRKERIYWIRKSTRKKKGMMKQKSFNFFCPWSWRKSNTMSWKKGIEGKMLQKRKKKKKKGKKRKMSVIQRLWKSTMRESLIYTNIFLEIMWSLPWINTYKEEPQKNLRFLRIFISIFTPSSLQIRLMLTLPGIFSDGLSGRRSVQGIRRGGMFMTGCTLSRIIVDWRDDFGWRARHVKGLWKGVVVERAM